MGLLRRFCEWLSPTRTITEELHCTFCATTERRTFNLKEFSWPYRREVFAKATKKPCRKCTVGRVYMRRVTRK